MSNGLETGLFTRTKVNPIRQTEIAECGLACVAMVSSFYGLDVDMATLRRRFGPSTRGATLKSLMIIADHLGYATRPVRLQLEHLDALPLPAILHWDLNHFVVLESVARGKALIHDPGGNSGWMRIETVSNHFTGVALELEPTSDFETGDARQRLKLTNLWGRIRGLERAVAQTALLSLVLQAFALASPYYLQLAVDSALPDLNLGFLTVLALGFGLFTVLNGIAAIIRASVLLTLGASFGYGLSTNLARRLFRLPIDWFERRHVGDILSRFQSVLPIRQMLAEDAPATLVDGVFAALTLILMVAYSALLASVACLALVVYTCVRWAFFRAQRSAQEGMIVATGREQSVLIETLRGMRSLRLSGKETFRTALWQSRMTDVVNGSVRYQRLGNWQTVIHTTLFALENVASVWLAVGLVIKGSFSLGMVFAFLAYKSQFLTAGASLVEKATAFKMLGLHLERISDIAFADEDIAFAPQSGDYKVLKGALELRNIRYRYGHSDFEVLKGVSLKVEAGESVAITGPSGGGKSTLIHILLGLYEPTDGEVLVDGTPLRSFGHQNYHRQIAAVLQDDTLFAGSIAENIAMFDDCPEMERIRRAAIAAAIHDDIKAMAMGYETLVGDMGSALSGGQRQRILLARALYREPRLLVMDEGTSSLDEERERQVNEAIAALGITRIIVAHRNETIASAERVLFLSQGRLTERLKNI